MHYVICVSNNDALEHVRRTGEAKMRDVVPVQRPEKLHHLGDPDKKTGRMTQLNGRFHTLAVTARARENEKYDEIVKTARAVGFEI